MNKIRIIPRHEVPHLSDERYQEYIDAIDFAEKRGQRMIEEADEIARRIKDRSYSNMMKTTYQMIKANVDNEKLSDKVFRDFVRSMFSDDKEN